MSKTQDPRLMEYQKMISSVKKLGTIKECFHHDKSLCGDNIKQSHSIQRNGRLSIIEGNVNGNSSVYTFTSAIATAETPMADLKPIGKKEASTFFGFCDEHDTKLFSPIENFAFDDSDKHCFLHSYRSYAHSYHRKHEEQKAYNNPETPLVKMMPQFIVDSMKKGIDLGVADSVKRKLYLDDAIENEKYDALEYLTFQKEGLYPFAVSSQMSPRVSYKNRNMNNHVDPNIPFSHPIITFLPDKSETFVILAAFPDDKNSIMLLDELSELSDDKLERAITSLIIANCENTFFSPRFWDNLSRGEQQTLLSEFKINTFNTTYHNKFFHSRFNFFDRRFEAKNLGIIK